MGHKPGEGKIYDLAMVSILVAGPILIIKPLIRFVLKLIVLSAITALIIGKVHPLPITQLLTASFAGGLILLMAIKVIKR